MNRIGPSIIHRLIYLKLQTPNLPNWQTMPKITNSKSSIHSKWSSNTPWFTSSEFRPYKAICFIISVSKEHTIQSSLKKPHTHLFFSFLISTYSSFFFMVKLYIWSLKFQSDSILVIENLKFEMFLFINLPK